MIIIQRRSFSNGVTQFVLKLNENINFEASYNGSRTNIQSLAKHRIHELKSRSSLAEVLRFLREPHTTLLKNSRGKPQVVPTISTTSFTF